jgi:hypothetical protein
LDLQTTIGILTAGYLPMAGAVIWLAKELVKVNKGRVDDAEKRMEHMEQTKKEILKATNKMIQATLKATDKK